MTEPELRDLEHLVKTANSRLKRVQNLRNGLASLDAKEIETIIVSWNPGDVQGRRGSGGTVFRLDWLDQEKEIVKELYDAITEVIQKRLTEAETELTNLKGLGA